MENNNDKKLYTLLVYSENIAGILNQITAVFTRRQVNIESLNVSASSIKNIHKYTITVWSDAEQIEKFPVRDSRSRYECFGYCPRREAEAPRRFLSVFLGNTGLRIRSSCRPSR